VLCPPRRTSGSDYPGTPPYGRNKNDPAVRIDETDWITQDIAVRVDATRQPDRIALEVSADARIVISEVVVVEIRFRVLLIVCLSTSGRQRLTPFSRAQAPHKPP
jgi:hypothetical protein